MNSCFISTNTRLKGVEPTRVKRCGFLWLRKKYEYNFVSPHLYRETLCKNPEVKIGRIGAVTGGIIRGNA